MDVRLGRDYLYSKAKCLKLDLDIPYAQILEEAKNLREKFVPYRSSYKTKGWYSLPIIGKSSHEPYSWHSYYEDAKDSVDGMTWTDIAYSCPVTKSWLENIYPSNAYARVRFMLLEAGGRIEPHTDTDLSILAAVNVALSNPEKCVWKWGDGKELHILPGEAYAMNISYEHSVINDSQEDRYHLIVHHYDSLDEYKKMMTRSMEIQNVQGEFLFCSELF